MRRFFQAAFSILLFACGGAAGVDQPDASVVDVPHKVGAYNQPPASILVAGAGIGITQDAGYTTITNTGATSDAGGVLAAGGDLTATDTTHQWIQSISGANNGGGAVTLKSSAWIQAASNSQSALLGPTGVAGFSFSGGRPVIETLTNDKIFFSNAGTTVATLDTSVPGLISSAADTLFAMGFYASPTSGSLGSSLILYGQQATGTSATSGNIDLNLFPPTAGGNEALVRLLVGSYGLVAALGATPGHSGAEGSLWLSPTITPSGTNRTLATSTAGNTSLYALGSGQTTIVDGSTNNTIAVGVGSVAIQYNAANQQTFNVNTASNGATGLSLTNTSGGLIGLGWPMTGGNGIAPNWNNTAYNVAGNINASAATTTIILLTGTMTGPITLTLPNAAEVMYWIDATNVFNGGGSLPFNITVTCAGASRARILGAGSAPSLWLVYIGGPGPQPYLSLSPLD
jgi:hypothetical protein